MKRPKTGHMEVRRDGEGSCFDEESDFEIEIGPRARKISEICPKLCKKIM